MEALLKEWGQLNNKQIDEAVKIVKTVWELIASKEHSIIFPHFDSNVECIVRQVTVNVILCRSHIPIGNGTNILITGIRGIGKTTLMRGLWTVLSYLEQSLVAIYYDFELQSPKCLFTLLKDRLSQKKVLVPDVCDQFGSLLENLHTRDFQVAMFLDEIQILYVPRGAVQYAKNNKILREILFLGKSDYNCYGILSSSSSNIREHTSCMTSLGYPNLHNSVFVESLLSPIRCKNKLSLFLDVNDPEIIDRYFSATGGVYSSLIRYKTDPKSLEPADQCFLSELSQFDYFFAVIMRLWSLQQTRSLWELAYLTSDELGKIVKPLLNDANSFSHILTRWLDAGFLYRTFGYQILVPDHLKLFGQLLNEQVSYALKGAVLATIGGWYCVPSAGHIIETHICMQLCRANIASNFWAMLNCQTPRIYLQNQELCTAIEPDNMGKLISLAFDEGIDAYLICADKDKEGYHLHTIQIQVGTRYCSIRPGAARSAESKDDKTIRGIIAKAQCGIRRILDHFNTAQIRINRITFTLLTTKKVTDPAVQTLKQFEKIECNSNQFSVNPFLWNQDLTLALLDYPLIHLLKSVS